mmetsp:Transcript_28653/g.63170  ORF Transcript_28653/g.63170 Transcript_28653/m.63170 type:complete len:218 (-) Transcript_28653:146-799(-)
MYFTMDLYLSFLCRYQTPTMPETKNELTTGPSNANWDATLRSPATAQRSKSKTASSFVFVPRTVKTVAFSCLVPTFPSNTNHVAQSTTLQRSGSTHPASRRCCLTRCQSGIHRSSIASRLPSGSYTILLKNAKSTSFNFPPAPVAYEAAHAGLWKELPPGFRVPKWGNVKFKSPGYCVGPNSPFAVAANEREKNQEITSANKTVNTAATDCIYSNLR